MSLLLKENEVCPHSKTCKYNENNSCHGASTTRTNKFVCDFVENGKVTESGQVRSSLDLTGNMKVIME